MVNRFPNQRLKPGKCFSLSSELAQPVLGIRRRIDSEHHTWNGRDSHESNTDSA